MCRWLFIFLILIATPILSTPPSIPSLSVRGQVSISKPADELQIIIGITTSGADAKTALYENNKKMNQLISALVKTGLNQKEYRTGRFSIRPLYNSRPHNASSDWEPKISGFEVVNMLNIQTDKLDQAGNLIDTATKAGANSINSIKFIVSDFQKYREELINAAALSALTDAKSLSEIAGVRLKRIISITSDDSGMPSTQPYMLKAMAAESTPIIAGDVEMKAGVTVVYEIE